MNWCRDVVLFEPLLITQLHTFLTGLGWIVLILIHDSLWLLLHKDISMYCKARNQEMHHHHQEILWTRCELHLREQQLQCEMMCNLKQLHILGFEAKEISDGFTKFVGMSLRYFAWQMISIPASDIDRGQQEAIAPLCYMSSLQYSRSDLWVR